MNLPGTTDLLPQRHVDPFREESFFSLLISSYRLPHIVGKGCICVSVCLYVFVPVTVTLHTAYFKHSGSFLFTAAEKLGDLSLAAAQRTERASFVCVRVCVSVCLCVRMPFLACSPVSRVADSPWTLINDTYN